MLAFALDKKKKNTLNFTINLFLNINHITLESILTEINFVNGTQHMGTATEIFCMLCACFCVNVI